MYPNESAQCVGVIDKLLHRKVGALVFFSLKNNNDGDDAALVGNDDGGSSGDKQHFLRARVKLIEFSCPLRFFCVCVFIFSCRRSLEFSFFFLYSKICYS